MNAMRDRLTGYGIPIGPCWTRFGKEALFFFKDPSGNLFELFCLDYPGADKLPVSGGSRAGGIVLDLADLNYDSWTGKP